MVIKLHVRKTFTRSTTNGDAWSVCGSKLNQFCLSVRLSVQKMCQNEDISSHFLDVLVAALGLNLVFLALRPLQNAKGNPSTGTLNTRRWENLANMAIYLGNCQRQGLLLNTNIDPYHFQPWVTLKGVKISCRSHNYARTVWARMTKLGTFNTVSHVHIANRLGPIVPEFFGIHIRRNGLT